MLSCYKLPLVESEAIIQQKLNIVCYKSFTQPINAVTQLGVNFEQTVNKKFSLLKREVKGLMHIIGEIGIFVHGAKQVSAAYDFRVKA